MGWGQRCTCGQGALLAALTAGLQIMRVACRAVVSSQQLGYSQLCPVRTQQTRGALGTLRSSSSRRHSLLAHGQAVGDPSAVHTHLEPLPLLLLRVQHVGGQAQQLQQCPQAAHAGHRVDKHQGPARVTCQQVIQQRLAVLIQD